MGRRTEAGDRVVVRMASNNVVPQGIQFEAKYIWGPAGPGDVFVFETDDGTRLHLNGNSPDFVGYWHATPENTDTGEGT